MSYHRRPTEPHDAELGIARYPPDNRSVRSFGDNKSSSGNGAGDKKSVYDDHEKQDVHVAPGETIDAAPPSSLHRGLKARHISMIAIGGAIGTGLIINTLVLVCPACLDASLGHAFVVYYSMF